MGRRLARIVVVRNERNEAVAFGPKDDVPEWAAALITNPAAWADESDEPPGIDQLRRIGATEDELAAIREGWAAMPAHERADVELEDSDESALAALEEARAIAQDHGMTLADALRKGIAERAADAGEANGSDVSEGDSDHVDGEGGGESNPPGDLTATPPPAGDASSSAPEPVEKPAANASTKLWRAYAVSQGMSEEDAQRRNRDELAGFYGS